MTITSITRRQALARMGINNTNPYGNTRNKTQLPGGNSCQFPCNFTHRA